MDELDMSRPGSELFPEAITAQPYNSYQDVSVGPAVGDPLDMGVKPSLDAANQGQLSQKEMNFEALRSEVSKMKEEREYWKGQAEAYSKAQTQQQVEDPIAKWDDYDWGDSGNVRKAFEAIRDENQRLRSEINDQLAAVQTKAQHSDWNNMVTQHVPQLTSKNPIFAEMINRSSNPYEAAYLLAELNAKTHTSMPGQQQEHTPAYNNGNGQRAIANAQKPQSMNAIGGNGSLSSADYYASMSDEDFMKVAARNMASI